MAPATHDAAVNEIRRLAREDGFAKLMRDHNLDIVLSASDADLISFSACAGWPAATVPVGRLKGNGAPWGFFAIAREGEVGVLMRFVDGFWAGFEGVWGPTRPFER